VILNAINLKLHRIESFYMLLIDQLKQTSFVISALKMVAGTILSQAIALIAQPVLSRIFLPDAFGVLGQLTSITAFLVVISAMRYDMSIVLAKDDSSASNIFFLCLGLLGLFCIGTHIMMHLAITRTTYFNHGPEVPAIVFSSGLLLNGIIMISQQWFIREQSFGLVSVVLLTQSIIIACLQLSMGLLGHDDAYPLIYGWLIGTGIAAFVSCYFVLRRSKHLDLSSLSWLSIKCIARRYKRFASIDVWSMLLNSLSSLLPYLILSYAFSFTILGYYALGQRIVAAPAAIVGNAVNKVFYQRSNSAKRNGTLTDLVKSTFGYLVLLTIAPYAVLTCMGKDFCELILGKNWSEAGVYIQIFSPFLFVNLTASIMHSLVFTFEKQWFNFKLQIIIFLTRLFSLILGAVYLNVYLIFFLYTLTGVVIYSYICLWALKITHTGFGFIKSLFNVFIICVLTTAGSLISLKHMGLSTKWLLLVSGLICFGYYAYVWRWVSKKVPFT
jgi:lipopolysaccharide exporter